jgi:hypothetical protein
VNCWKDKTIKINDSWGPITNSVLRVPLGCSPVFSMRGRYLRTPQGTEKLGQIHAEISSGYLSDGWQRAVFTPVGTVPVKGIYGLPPWDPSQSQVYRDMIDGPNNNLGDSRTMRLEGVIPYANGSGDIGYETVRLFYAFNAVQGAPIADLVIVKSTTLLAVPGTVKVSDDGGGQGPPD